MTLPPQTETTEAHPEVPAQVSYTSEELSLWQHLCAYHADKDHWHIVAYFEAATGKPHDPAFLI